jgi:hypothetical protein
LQPPVRDKFASSTELGLVGRQDVAGRRNTPVFYYLDSHDPPVASALKLRDSLGPLARELADLPQPLPRCLIRSQALGPATRPPLRVPVITVCRCARPPVSRWFFLAARLANGSLISHSAQLPSPSAPPLSSQPSDSLSLCFCNLGFRGMSGPLRFFDVLQGAPEGEGTSEFLLRFIVDDLGEPDQACDRQEREPEQERERVHVSLAARW